MGCYDTLHDYVIHVVLMLTTLHAPVFTMWFPTSSVRPYIKNVSLEDMVRGYIR